MSAPLPHSAVLRLTGWATATDEGVRIGGVLIRTSWRPDGGAQRVSVTAWPRTGKGGELRGVVALPRQFRPARGPNAARFEVTGQLLRVDRSSGELRVKVCPARSALAPFMLQLHATSQVLAELDPAAASVRVSGRLLGLARPALLAEVAEIVHAPTPPQWVGHRPKRGYGAAIARAQVRPAPLSD